MAIPTTPKPQPQADDDHTVHMCGKCNGTGFYCMGTLNDKPYSRTGFQCHPCGGTGWRVRIKRGRKQAVQARQYKENAIAQLKGTLARLSEAEDQLQRVQGDLAFQVANGTKEVYLRGSRKLVAQVEKKVEFLDQSVTTQMDAMQADDDAVDAAQGGATVRHNRGDVRTM